MTEPTDILAITRAADQAAEALREKHADDLTFVPEWAPLQLALPEAEWGGWMFMAPGNIREAMRRLEDRKPVVIAGLDAITDDEYEFIAARLRTSGPLYHAGGPS